MKEHVIIGKDRTVAVPDSLKKIGIQFDHNVNTITFDCPRYPDEDPSVDMSQMPIFINYMLPDKTPGSSLAENVVIDPDDESLIHFDWKITNAVTPVNGVLSSLICIKKTDTEGNELYHWNTELFQKFTVGNGMECTEQVADMHPDVITQLLARMGAVDERTSEEAMRGYVNECMTQNPPQPTDEQVGTGVNAYMTENGQTHVDSYMNQNAQDKVDDYLGRNPLQLDETLTDPTKAAPANMVGELKGDLVNLSSEIANYTKPLEDLPDKFFKIDLQITNGARYIIVNTQTGYVPTKSTSITFMSCAVLNVTAGERFRFNTYGTTANLAYIGFADDEGKIIGFDKYIEVAQKIVDYDFKIPSGASMLYLNGDSNMTLHKIDKETIASIQYVNNNAVIMGAETVTSQTDDTASWNTNISMVDAIKAYSNGLLFDLETEKFRLPLSDNFSHTSYIAIHGNYAYITLMKNDVSVADYSSDINTYVSLIVFDLENNQIVSNQKVVGYGDVVGNLSVISGCAGLTINIHNNKVYMQASVKLSDTKWYTIMFTYDIATSTLSNAQPCKLKANGVEYDFTTDNFSEHISSIENTDSGVGCTLTYNPNDGYFYGICMCVDYLPKGICVKTNDFITYEYAFTPNVDVNGRFECDLFYFNNVFYYAMREKSSGYATLAKIDIATYKVLETYRIVDSGSRLTYYNVGDRLYLIHSICNRMRTEIVEINTRKLANSGVVSQPTLSCVYPSVATHGEWCYLASTNTKSTKVYLRRYKKELLSNIEITNKMLKLLCSINL